MHGGVMMVWLQDHIQRILLALAVKVEAVHRSSEKRRLLLAYNLFVQLVCREVREEGLEGSRSFIVMDVVHTMVRIVSKDKKSECVVKCTYMNRYLCRQ